MPNNACNITFHAHSNSKLHLVWLTEIFKGFEINLITQHKGFQLRNLTLVKKSINNMDYLPRGLCPSMSAL